MEGSLSCFHGMLFYVTSVEIRKSGVDRDQGWDMGDGITYLCDMVNQRILMPY